MLQQTQVATNAAAAVEVCGPNNSRRTLVIQNLDGTNAVLIGGSNVTASGAAGGVRLAAGAREDFIGTMAQEAVFAIAAAGTPLVAILEQIN